jgi:hypothetical protein
LVVDALPGAGFDQNSRICAVRAKADAFVTEASRNQNFGRTRELLVDASPTARTYVRFEVDLKSGDVRHVSLLLYSRKRLRTGYQARLVRSDWREARITYVNAPRLAPTFVASGPVRARAWKAVDVTSLVAGAQDSISFVLTTTSVRGGVFSSRETGLHGPRLVVETMRNDTTQSTTTTTAKLPRAP